MWSLGCIIADIATYLYNHGTNAVKAFEERRKIRIGGCLTTYTFHGGHVPNPGVQSWLSELEGQASSAGTELIDLVKQMLRIKPTERPGATQAVRTLRRITLSSLSRTSLDCYEKLLRETGGIDLLVERERFKIFSWRFDANNSLYEQIQDQEIIVREPSFNECVRKMELTMGELTNRAIAQTTASFRLFKLRKLNNEIVGLLPATSRRDLESELEQQMVQTHDLSLLDEIKNTFDDSSAYRAIGALAAVRHMHALCQSPKAETGTDLLTQKPALENRYRVDNYELASLIEQPAQGKVTRPVLLEQVLYQGELTDAIKAQLFARVAAIADLLRSASHLRRTKVLQCMGYFHEPRSRAFTLTFSIPLNYAGTNPVSLRTIIQDTQRQSRIRPKLEDRFQLSHKLATALFEIHSVHWLHKSFSAFNILFFAAEQPATTALALASPYLIGFNHSRQNDPHAFSQKEETQQTDYQHPDCSQPEIRFRQEHDCFSLGMVLLEIGLWRTLKSMTKGKETLAPVALVGYILQEWVPLLDFFVGATYRAVVVACLTGDLEAVHSASKASEQVSDCCALDHFLVRALRSLVANDPA